MWTNTCCSHPLDTPSETGVELEAAIHGACRAAQRKLNQELGIPTEQVPPEIFHFLTRIHYKAPSNGPWGEHESKSKSLGGRFIVSNSPIPVDYILFAQAEVDLDVNPNEVKDTRYVTPDQLRAMFREPALTFTPWFRLICESMLFEWWENFDNLQAYKNEKGIRRM